MQSEKDRLGTSTLELALLTGESDELGHVQVNPLVAFQESPEASVEVESGTLDPVSPFMVRWLERLGVTHRDLRERGIDIALLERLFKAQTHLFQSFYWMNMNYFFERISHALCIKRSAVFYQHPSYLPSCMPGEWMWLRGRSIPVKSQRHLLAIYGVSFFRHGVEWSIRQMLHMTLTAFALFQIIEANDYNPLTWVEIYRNSEKKTLYNLMYTLSQNKDTLKKAIPFLIAFPMVIGLLQVVLNVPCNLRTSRGRLALQGASIQRQSRNFWTDWVRWFFPLYWFDSTSQRLAHQLRWDGRIAHQNRVHITDALTLAFKSSSGITRYKLLQRLSKLAYGSHPRDLMWLKKSESREARLAYLYAKAQSFASVVSVAEHPVRGLRSWVEREMAQYWLWSIGAWRPTAPQRLRAVVYWLYHLGMTYTYFGLAHNLYQVIEDYLNCPDKPGVTLTGTAHWSSDFSEKCFLEHVKLFRKIPGQPLDTLLTVIPNTHFTSPELTLNLSNKLMNGTEIARLLEALAGRAHITELDASGNRLGYVEDYEALMPSLPLGLRSLILKKVGLEGLVVLEGTSVRIYSCQTTEKTTYHATKKLGEGLSRQSSLESLSLSGNGLGCSGDAGIESLMRSLSQLIHFKSLDLSQTGLDIKSTASTEQFAAGLVNLTALTSLDLHGTAIGFSGESGTQKLAQSLGMLNRLTYLDLKDTQIGNQESSGVKALGENLGNLNQLIHLDLSHTSIGMIDASGVERLGESLGNLTNLTYLDLSYAWLGSTGTAGVERLGRNMRFLSQLSHLDLGGNSIGLYGEAGVVQIGDALGNLTRLTYLDLSNEEYVTGTVGVERLCEGVAKLGHLIHMDFGNTGAGYSTTAVKALALGLNNSALSLTYLDLGSTGITLPESDVLANSLLTLYALTYCNLEGVIFSIDITNKLNLHLEALGFQGLIPMIGTPSDLQLWLAHAPADNWYLRIGTDDVLRQFFLALAKRTNVQSVNLIYETGCFNEVDFDGLGQASQLTHFGFHGAIELMGTACSERFITMLTMLKNLTVLDLSQTNIGQEGTAAMERFGEGLGNLTSLRVLNLRGSNIGFSGTAGMERFGEGLGNLTRLTALDLSGTSIGTTATAGVERLGEGLGRLTQLESLNLSHTFLGSNGMSGVERLGESLGNLKRLKVLDLNHAAIAVKGPAGMERIGESLSNLTNLLILNLRAMSNLGLWGSATVEQLGEGLGYLSNLTNLDLSMSGKLEFSGNTLGTQKLGQGIASLNALRSLNLSHSGIGQAGFEGTQALARAIQKLPNIIELDLGYTQIGSTGNEGIQSLLEAIVNSTSLQTVNIEGLSSDVNPSVFWDVAGQQLAKNYESQLKSACQAELCFKHTISVETNSSIDVNFLQKPHAEGETRILSSLREHLPLPKRMRTTELTIGVTVASVFVLGLMAWIKLRMPGSKPVRIPVASRKKVKQVFGRFTSPAIVDCGQTDSPYPEVQRVFEHSSQIVSLDLDAKPRRSWCGQLWVSMKVWWFGGTDLDTPSAGMSLSSTTLHSGAESEASTPDVSGTRGLRRSGHEGGDGKFLDSRVTAQRGRYGHM